MSERWKPERGEDYYFVNSLSCIGSYMWRDDSTDRQFYEIGNCFKKKAEAEATAEKVKALLLSLHEPATNSSQLPKLTAEVFDRPDCPEWAQWAAVDMNGIGTYFESKPSIPSWCPWWDRTIKHYSIGNFEKWDSSDWQHSLIERPARLPGWCKVGEWCFCLDDDGNCKYFNITKIKDNFIYGEDWVIDYHFVKQARFRPYNAEEMQGIVGKVVGNERGGMFLVTTFIADDGGKVCVDSIAYKADALLYCYTINGKPCGVLEHLSENGEWVE